MSLVSLPAMYDGKQIRLLEAVPVHGPYHVLVTFLEPADVETNAHDTPRFWSSFGAWQDDRPIEATLQDIHDARRSKPEPPTL